MFTETWHVQKYWLTHRGATAGIHFMDSDIFVQAKEQWQYAVYTCPGYTDRLLIYVCPLIAKFSLNVSWRALDERIDEPLLLPFVKWFLTQCRAAQAQCSL